MDLRCGNSIADRRNRDPARLVREEVSPIFRRRKSNALRFEAAQQTVADCDTGKLGRRSSLSPTAPPPALREVLRPRRNQA